MGSLFPLLLKIITDYNISVCIEKYHFANGFNISFSKNSFRTSKIVRDYEVCVPGFLQNLFEEMVSELLKNEAEIIEAVKKINQCGIVIDLKGADNGQREAD